jgi:uncharacterized protein (DUF2252 family)
MGKKDVPLTVINEIIRFNQDRKPKRVQIKLQRMAAGPFPFFRGTDHLFARAWPALKPPNVGPALWISGDLHLENFGAYQTDNGDFRYDINDFDEALIAPCSLDLVRCTTSILLAAEEWQLTPLQATGIALVFLEQYRAAVTETPDAAKAGAVTLANGEGPLWDLLGLTAVGSQVRFLDTLTRKNKTGIRCLLPDQARFPPISSRRAALVRKAVEQYGRRRKRAKAYRVLDVRGRIAGIGSLGLRRYTVLIHGDGSPDRNRVLDIKEARPSSLLSCTSHRQPDTAGNEAQRIVDAQRQLQGKPAVGLDVIEIDGIPFRMRELVPDENRSRLDRLQNEPEKLRSAVAAAGRITGWSQIRGCDVGLEDRFPDLVRWATGPALDSVLAAGVRYADRTLHEYQEFHRAYVAGWFDDMKKRSDRIE